jgi:hypothetical protein
MNEEADNRQNELLEFTNLVNSLCRKYQVQLQVSITDLKTIKKQDEPIQKSGPEKMDVREQASNGEKMAEGDAKGKEVAETEKA